MTLQTAGESHLWTIAPEIKYYLFIPFFCILAHKSGKYNYIFLFICLLWSLLNEKFNFLDVQSWDDEVIKGYVFKTRFAIFFYGSISAMILVIIENNLTIKNVIKTKIFQFLIFIASLLVLYYGFKFTNKYFLGEISNLILFEAKSARVWAFFILLMTLGAPNFLTRRLSNNNSLKMAGKFSFGIYLWHPIVVLFGHRQKFDTILEQLTLILSLAYFVGYLFFCLIENPLLILASKICKQIDNFFNFNKHLM